MPLNPGNAGGPAENVAVEDNIGSLSSKVAFIQPLGNPLRNDTTKVKDANGAEVPKITSFIVGYRFKALADIDVPDCGTTEKFKKDYMNFDEAKLNNTKHVKAGETFDLTPFETALLGSWPEFNKMFTGEDRAVVVAYAKPKVDAGSGKINEIPRAVLRLASTQGSIKDYGILDVCEKKMVPGPDGKEIKTGVIKPGFEKWAPLCIRGERKSAARTGAGGVKKVGYDKNAKSFLELLKTKGYQH
jgi:hypothetical protein